VPLVASGDISLDTHLSSSGNPRDRRILIWSDNVGESLTKDRKSRPNSSAEARDSLWKKYGLGISGCAR